MGEMIERIAQAIYEGRNGHGAKPWTLQPRQHREPYLKDAVVTIDEIEKIILDTEPRQISDRGDQIWTRRMAVALHERFASLPSIDSKEVGTPAPVEGVRGCTCHPDDNPPVPCAERYALSECRSASLQPKLGAFAKAAEFSALVREYRSNTDNDHGARLCEDLQDFLMENLCEIEEALSALAAIEREGE